MSRSMWLLVQREVAEHIVAALDAGGGSMDQLCRLLLAADSYSVVLLRNYCLAGLAQAFHSLQHHTAREQAIFEAFVDAVAPKVCVPVGPDFVPEGVISAANSIIHCMCGCIVCLHMNAHAASLRHMCLVACDCICQYWFLVESHNTYLPPICMVVCRGQLTSLMAAVWVERPMVILKVVG